MKSSMRAEDMPEIQRIRMPQLPRQMPYVNQRPMKCRRIEESEVRKRLCDPDEGTA